MKYSNNNLIILLFMNIEAESAIYMEKSFTICRYQIDKLDCLNIGNIDDINKDIVLLWYKIIFHNGQLIEVNTNINMNYNYYKFNSLRHPNSSTGILESIIGKIEMLEEYLTKIKSSRFSNNP